MDKVKKILYVFIVSAIISLPVAAPVFALPELPPLEAIEQNNVTPEEINQPVEQSVEIKPSSGEIERNSFQEPYDRSDLKNEVVPTSGGELFRVAIMFLKVMAAVLLCGGAIYLLLWLVKKYYYKGETSARQDFSQQITGSSIENGGDLKSPQDENEALKNFLNQTKNR